MLLVLKGERATLHTPLYGTYAIYGTYAFSVVRVEWSKSKAPHSFIWNICHKYGTCAVNGVEWRKSKAPHSPTTSETKTYDLVSLEIKTHQVFDKAVPRLVLRQPFSE